jgi:hypothetical protein
MTLLLSYIPFIFLFHSLSHRERARVRGTKDLFLISTLPHSDKNQTLSGLHSLLDLG